MSQDETKKPAIITAEEMHSKWPDFCLTLERPLQMLFQGDLVIKKFGNSAIVIEVSGHEFLYDRSVACQKDLAESATKFYGAPVSVVVLYEGGRPKTAGSGYEISVTNTKPQAEEWKAPIELHGWIKVWSYDELFELTKEKDYLIPGVAHIYGGSNFNRILTVHCAVSGLNIGFMEFSDSLAADVTGRPFILPNWVLDAFQVKDKPLPELKPTQKEEIEKLWLAVNNLLDKLLELSKKARE